MSQARIDGVLTIYMYHQPSGIPQCHVCQHKFDALSPNRIKTCGFLRLLRQTTQKHDNSLRNVIINRKTIHDEYGLDSEVVG